MDTRRGTEIQMDTKMDTVAGLIMDESPSMTSVARAREIASLARNAALEEAAKACWATVKDADPYFNVAQVNACMAAIRALKT